MSVLPKLIPATCAVLSLVSLGACTAAADKGQLGPPVAKINGSVITKPELDRAVKALLAQNPAAPAPEQLKKVTEAALDRLASAELLYQEACKLEIKDLEHQVAERYAQNKAKFPSEAEYQKALKGFGMTEDEVRLSMRKEIVVNAFIEREFASQTTVSEEEVRKFYDENRERYFKQGERVSASHILVGVDPKGSPEQKKQAREKAEALLKRVRAGEDFAALARKESTCPSAARGGELGVFGKGQMAPSFEKGAFALQPGEVSPVVETQFGFHIIKVTERLAPSTEKFEEVREKISAFLKASKTQQALATFVAKLRSKARIEKV